MGKGKTVIEQPDPINVGQSIRDYMEAISDPNLQAKIIGAEARGRPQYQKLELADQEAALFGTDDQAGLIELQRRASEAFAPIEQAAKEREVAMLGTLGGQVTQALRDADPKAARMADLQAQQAERLYAESEGMLSPERAREAEQAAARKRKKIFEITIIAAFIIVGLSVLGLFIALLLHHQGKI